MIDIERIEFTRSVSINGFTYAGEQHGQLNAVVGRDFLASGASFRFAGHALKLHGEASGFGKVASRATTDTGH